jgi:hypothetical protein
MCDKRTADCSRAFTQRRQAKASWTTIGTHTVVLNFQRHPIVSEIQPR